jgi:MoxR-like ATPase
MIAILSRGHCLMVGRAGAGEDAAGQHARAGVSTWSFKRIQFTPDLMPSDITGTEVLEEDRLHRRAVLPVPEAAGLHERRARGRDQPDAAQDAGGAARGDAGVPASPPAATRHELEAPFFVLATQNPIEQEGTYPLPEAQLDRFMFKHPRLLPEAGTRRWTIVQG